MNAVSLMTALFFVADALETCAQLSFGMIAIAANGPIVFVTKVAHTINATNE
jgi:hypothetical protein